MPKENKMYKSSKVCFIWYKKEMKSEKDRGYNGDV